MAKDIISRRTLGPLLEGWRVYAIMSSLSVWSRPRKTSEGGIWLEQGGGEMVLVAGFDEDAIDGDPRDVILRVWKDVYYCSDKALGIIRAVAAHLHMLSQLRAVLPLVVAGRRARREESGEKTAALLARKVCEGVQGTGGLIEFLVAGYLWC